jgi:DNA-binding transcriptional ArsR family regulator
MSETVFVSHELAKLLSVLSHQDRVRIVSELRSGERDVNSLRDALGLTQARVSQQLALMRSYQLVRIRRQGRHVFYRLSQPLLAEWLLDGLRFVEGEEDVTAKLLAALGQARQTWMVPANGNHGAVQAAEAAG